MLSCQLKRLWGARRAAPSPKQATIQGSAALQGAAQLLGPSSHDDVKDLDSRLKQLIAEQENSNRPAEERRLSPDDITVQYILDERESRIYPTIQYIVHSPYGGYDHAGVRCITRKELEAIAQQVEAEMARF